MNPPVKTKFTALLLALMLILVGVVPAFAQTPTPPVVTFAAPTAVGGETLDASVLTPDLLAADTTALALGQTYRLAVNLTNSGDPITLGRVKLTIAAGATCTAAPFAIEYWEDYGGANTWLPLGGTCAAGVWSYYFGPATGFPIAAGYNATTQLKATVSAAGVYPVNVVVVDMSDAPLGTPAVESLAGGIKAALDAAAANQTVQAAAGTFAEPALALNADGVTFKGVSQTATIIQPKKVADGATYPNSGSFMLGGDNLTLRDFTLDAQVPHYTTWPPSQPFYGLYISGPRDAMHLEDVTVKAHGKSGLNLNGATDVALVNVSALDNGGAGIFLTNSHDIELENAYTSNNQWGGVAVNTVTKDGDYTPGSDGIVIDGTFDESATPIGGLYIEEESYHNGPITPITWGTSGDVDVLVKAEDFGYILRGPQDDGPTRRTRFYSTLAQAQAAATTPAGFGHYLAAGRTVQSLDLMSAYVFKGAPTSLAIQPAIDVSPAGATVNVFPGTYDETAPNSVIYNGVTYTFGLFIGQAKPGLTVQGVDANGVAITDAADVVAEFTTNATNSFGTSGSFIEADNVTLAGLRFLRNIPGDNKTIEVIGDNFTLKNSVIDVPDSGSVYLGDWRYDTLNSVSYLQSYRIEGNLFKQAASLDIANGAGATGDAAGRVIQDNTFTYAPADYWAAVSFNGIVPSVGWFNYPVGAAEISGNTFSGTQKAIRTRGIVNGFSDAMWKSYLTGNTFDKTVVVGPDPANGVLTAYSYISGSSLIENVKQIGGLIQPEIDHAQNGDTILVSAGTFAETPKLPQGKSGLKLLGAGIGQSIIELQPVSGTSGLEFFTPGAILSGFTIQPGTGAADGIGINWSGLGSGSTFAHNRVEGFLTGLYLASGLHDAVIQHNVLTGNANGILFESVANVNISDNQIIDNDREDSYWVGKLNAGLRLMSGYPVSGLTLHHNQIFGSALGVDNNQANPIDAQKNWWGSAALPTAQVTGSTNVNPWCANPECSAYITMSGTTITIPAGTPAATVKTIIETAPAGSTIILPTGETFTGGITLAQDGLTINLNGATFGPGSPAFTIVGDNVSLLGPGSLTGGGSTSPAVLVQAGADNFMMRDVNISGWAQGIQVAGAVEGLKLASNYLHDNTGAGLKLDAAVTGLVTIEGNLFKANGIGIDSFAAVKAQYNSFGHSGPLTSSDVSTLVDASNATFAEVFMDVEPDALASGRTVNEGAVFNVAVKVDAAKLYAVEFKLTYDATMLTLNTVTAGAFQGTSACVEDHATAGQVSMRCTRVGTEAEVDGIVTVATLNFTAKTTLSGNGPWTQNFDLLPSASAAGAKGGVKVFLNNANGASVRDITDANDGTITINGLANYTGLVDLQGRLNDSGATVKVFDAATRSSAVQMAQATSAMSGSFTTAYAAGKQLVIGETYYLFVDAPLFLPTTITGADYAHAKALVTRPLTALATVVLLGGDATNDDLIGVGDIGCIGSRYNLSSTTCGASGSSNDVNGDGKVDLLDLVLTGGNYELVSSPWVP